MLDFYLHKGKRLLFMLCAVFSTHFSFAQCDFQEVSAEQQISHRFRDGLLGSGVSFVDFDGDGWDDLTFGTSEGELIEAYRNNQGQFERITLQGVTSTCESKQITWVDYDNDGDKDLYFSCVGDNLVLYRNNGDLTFTDVTDAMNLQSPIGSALGSNWADFDRDGWLDLYATYYGGTRSVVYRNAGGTGFQNVTEQSNAATNIKPTFCGVVFDYNNDGWEDIYLANDRSTGNDLFKNKGFFGFEDVSEESESNLAMDAMGTTLLDMNHDGYFEVYISNSPVGNALIFNNGDGTFTDIAEASGTIFNSVGWGVNTLDFDNDGRDDLYVSGSEIGTENLSSALYRAVSSTEFEQTHFEGMAADTMSSFSNAVGDFNRDGRMDIAVSNSNGTPSQLWQNNCANEYHWLNVKLQGQVSNRDGIGSRVAVYAGGSPLYQYLTAGTSFMAQNADYLHFGLEANTAVDSIIVDWSSGLIDKYFGPYIDERVTLIEGTTERPLQILGANADSNLCEGESVTLSVELYKPSIDFLWSTGETTPDIEVTKPGKYSVEIVVDGLTFQSEEVEIIFNPAPDVTVSTIPVSEGRLGSISITENNGVNSYDWAHDRTETSKDLSGLTPGIYTLTITNESGCETGLSITIEREVVTSLDDPLQGDIEYRFESGELVINLPVELAVRLQESRLLNAHGKELQRVNQTVKKATSLRFKGIPGQQLIILHLIFDEGRLIKKLILRD